VITSEIGILGLEVVLISRGWWNMEFGYTVTKIIRAPSYDPPLLPPKKGKFPTSYVKNILNQVIGNIF